MASPPTAPPAPERDACALQIGVEYKSSPEGPGGFTVRARMRNTFTNFRFVRVRTNTFGEAKPLISQISVKETRCSYTQQICKVHG